MNSTKKVTKRIRLRTLLSRCFYAILYPLVAILVIRLAIRLAPGTWLSNPETKEIARAWGLAVFIGTIASLNWCGFILTHLIRQKRFRKRNLRNLILEWMLKLVPCFGILMLPMLVAAHLAKTPLSLWTASRLTYIYIPYIIITHLHIDYGISWRNIVVLKVDPIFAEDTEALSTQTRLDL